MKKYRNVRLTLFIQTENYDSSSEAKFEAYQQIKEMRFGELAENMEVEVEENDRFRS